MTFQAVFNGHVIARSDQTVVIEGNRYFPPSSVEFRYLQRSWFRSLCYWKGIASYYNVDTGDARDPHGAWTYRHPTPFARRIKGHVAFWPGTIRVGPA